MHYFPKETHTHTQHPVYLMDSLVVLGHSLIAALPQEVPVNPTLVASSTSQAGNGTAHTRVGGQQNATLTRQQAGGARGRSVSGVEIVEGANAERKESPCLCAAHTLQRTLGLDDSQICVKPMSRDLYRALVPVALS